MIVHAQAEARGLPIRIHCEQELKTTVARCLFVFDDCTRVLLQWSSIWSNNFAVAQTPFQCHDELAGTEHISHAKRGLDVGFKCRLVYDAASWIETPAIVWPGARASSESLCLRREFKSSTHPLRPGLQVLVFKLESHAAVIHTNIKDRTPPQFLQSDGPNTFTVMHT